MKDTSKILKTWLTDSHTSLLPLYLVGGTVRDMLMNRRPKDIDLACKGAKALANDLSKKRNLALVAMEKKKGEPCYRVVDREDGNNFLDIAELRGDTIYDDLKRRDFTINAMGMEVKEDGSLGEIIDPFSGAPDIEQKIIKIVEDHGFISDPLRILRAIRLAANLDFEIESSTISEMEKRTALLNVTSSERIYAELLLILSAPRVAANFRLMDESGILKVIFPEIELMKGCEQNSFHHKDVWEHSLLVMENCEGILNDLSRFFGDQSQQVADNLNRNNCIPLLKLSAFLHDVGKPMTRGLKEETGRITFYGHEKEGATMADLIAERLKTSKRDRDFITLMIAEHMHVFNLVYPNVKARTKMKWFRKMKEDAVPSIILGIADIQGALGADFSPETRKYSLDRLKGSVSDYYARIKKRLERKPLVTGRDLMGLGMKPGPEMGQILRKITEAQDEGEIRTQEEALALAGKFLNC